MSLPLKSIRRRNLLSQRDLARRANITASTVYLVENGRVVPRIKVMRALCDALGIEDPMEVDEFKIALETA